MDEYLLDYLRSGKAWLLVGSGPSAAIGLPSWKQLASVAVELCKVETIGRNLTSVERAFQQNNFSKVFDEAASLVGMPLLLQHLSMVIPANPCGSPGKNVYSHLAKWPISVYLTTNFDNEILRHLALAGESTFIDYANSPDHLSKLLPDASGLVVHLHGDLRSEAGLVLTSSQYQQILGAANWEYWRAKMTAVFQMNRVIVIGHSLTDPHIRHVLTAAKTGSGVVQPVCWIAPDVDPSTTREYLEKFRIRVISYDNRDGTHRNLVRLVETLSDFVPPRLTVHLSSAIKKVSSSRLGPNAAAPGFFVFSKLSAQNDFEEKRSDVLVAALHAAIPHLKTAPAFSIQQALEIVGWPSGSPIPPELAVNIGIKAVAERLLVPDGKNFLVSAEAEEQLRVESGNFEHLRQRFQLSLQNRLRRDFSSLQPEHVTEIASDIDAALAGFFREGGLTLASTLSAGGPGPDRPTIPSSIVGFVNQASAKYNDYLRRQAFCAASLGCFIHSDAVEREYLGRVSQGFFGFHLMGVFGDAAAERLKHAKETVWLVDSSVQISAIALASATHLAFSDTFQSLSKLGLRFFSSDGLFDETKEHLWFANKIITDYGASSHDVISAAKGNVPYRKVNLFLEGFINWQAAGNPADWQKYLISIGGLGHIGTDVVRSALEKINISSMALSAWPGFQQAHFAEADDAIGRIVEIFEQRTTEGVGADVEELRSKAKPEAEAVVIVTHERDGEYHMLSQAGKKSSAWFLSQTAVLNKIRQGPKITWQPEAFLRFASTLIPITDEKAAEKAFGTLMWSIAQSGVTVLDSRVATRVFGGIIDQAQLTISEQHIAYDQVLADKYGSSEMLMEQVPALDRPLVALQLANERAERESAMRVTAQAIAAEEKTRAARAEAELADLQKFRKKLQEKQNQAAQRKRKNRSRKKKR
jgi:hypothetical protein